MTTTCRLTVEYEGTRYRGWQEQKNARTVAGELRSALEKTLGEKVELGGAGRTDAGVHALEQVAHLKFAGALRARDLLREVNDALPPDIHLLSIRPAAARFHARHEARMRSYVYQIALRRTALAKRFVWWVRQPLDLQAMSSSAALITGRHNFARFCEKPEEATSTLVVVDRVELARQGDLVVVRIAASHFLWKMVRRLVGALAAVGTGELEPRGLSQLIDGAAFQGFEPAAHTAPPSGLFLERVMYDGDPPLGPLAAPVPVAAAPR